ncbi:MAG: cytochrome c oxidase subunit 3 [Candidatus Omnitrophica bacterium]|nr:cytochrome c oxidase subunit 3 [Candidatus Omnitrophota bacterium]
MHDTELVPYKVEAREDTGLYNAKFGLWLFLASEIMLFGSLFSAYILLRVGSFSWPQQSDYLNVPIGALNSVILLSSSIFFIRAWVALKADDLAKYKRLMWWVISLAGLFLFFKGIEYYQHFSRQEYPKTSVFLALYFLLTGLHALHILAGIGINIYYAGPGTRLRTINKQWFINRLEVAGLYWHFVDIIWIFLFSILYLL